jgi:DHA2 family multidrug resistance protein-like MFS transporter
VLVTAYQAHLILTGLPTAAAGLVKQSVFAGVAVGEKLHSTALVESVRSSFVTGMDAALVVSAGTAAVAMVLALIFLPGRAPSAARAESPAAERVA